MEQISKVEADNYDVLVPTKDMNRFLTKVYGITSISMLLTATAATIDQFTLVKQIAFNIEHGRWLNLIFDFILPLLVIIWAAGRCKKHVNPSLNLGILAIGTGVELGNVFALLKNSSAIILSFASASIIFITMTMFGKKTIKDVANMRFYLTATLVALVFASLLNLIVRTGPFAYIMSYFAIIIFSILLATDSQDVKETYEDALLIKLENDAKHFHEDSFSSKIALIGAADLYLDFLNLFIEMLHIFSHQTDKKEP